ncbi:hypothetical protein BDV28DRAFT_110941 [Aspergillus coremiiformis]|uniref:Uncharacterized protein n=1 Tax=Aspergillus coremiiformis TaxID=138285 RepID=A0A5N6Z6H9_9EURO|nr:hypothetical protein BDV28DRAFT_110941 [Aspergillus coremiiformis]
MSQNRSSGASNSPNNGQRSEIAPGSAGRQTNPIHPGALGPQDGRHPGVLRDASLSRNPGANRLLSGVDMASVPLDQDAYYVVSTPCFSRVVNIITHHVLFSHELYRFFMYRLLKHFLWSEMDMLRIFSNWILPIDTHRLLQLVQEPSGLGMPQICLGYLFSEEIYGNDVDVPLYYFNIVQGWGNSVKVVITPSKSGAAGAAYYQAARGYSTVAIFAICQRALRRCREANLAFSFKRAHNVTEANEFLDQDPVRVGLIF